MPKIIGGYKEAYKKSETKELICKEHCCKLCQNSVYRYFVPDSEYSSFWLHCNLYRCEVNENFICPKYKI